MKLIKERMIKGTMKLLKSRAIVIHPDDEGLVDNRVRAYKTESDYRVVSEGQTFGVFPLTPSVWQQTVRCFEETHAAKQLEFDSLEARKEQ